MYETVSKINYSELLFYGNLTPIIIDGLDGTGKETSSRLIADNLSSKGYNSLIVSYPQYNTYWGKIIKSFLIEDGENFDLSLKERMLIYALNRLESVQSIKKTVEENYSKHSQFIIFDRFSTSNLLTYSYFTKDTPDIDKKDLSEVYGYMQSIDSLFLSELRIPHVPIMIPTLDPKSSSELLKNDNKTNSKDSYEKLDVQKKAYEVYRFISQYVDKGRFEFIPIATSEGIISPHLVANTILAKSMDKVIKKGTNLDKSGDYFY